MGKSKPRSRVKNNRDNPASKPPADPVLAALREQRILPVIRDLQSPELKTRSSAARAIANIIEDEKSRKLLLREQLVRILFEQTLTDSNLETRMDGWGILKNIAIEEEADFAVHLYRQDILTAIDGVVKTVCVFKCCKFLKAYCSQIGDTIVSKNPPFENLPKAQKEVLWNLTGSILSLLSSLAEAQDEIVEAITKLPAIIAFLFGLLAFESTPDEVQSEVLSCLTALTEDNKVLGQQIVDHGDWLSGLLQLREKPAFLAVPTCGVLHNIFVAMQWFDHNTPMEETSDAILVSTLVQYIEPVSKTNGTNGHTNSSPDQILQLALEITASIATSLQEALEHGSKHEKAFEGFDDAIEPLEENDDNMNEDGEHEEGEEEDEMDDDEIDADMELVTGDGPDEDDSPSEEITLDRLVRIATPKILALARPSSDPTVSEIQSSALSALNNIAWTISSIDFSTGHLDSLHKYWQSLSQQIWNEVISPVLASNTADIDLASSVTSLAWAVSRSVKGAIKIRPEEQRKFMALYQASKGLKENEAEVNGAKKVLDEDTDAFQGLGVKCIGVLGSLALDPAPIDLNREIGVFLLTVLSSLPDAAPADAVEALNQIFDIYADKSFAFDGPVFWGNSFYKHLEEVQPKVKKMVKSIDKRKFGELRSRADEAILNLGRFLVYKRKEKAAK